MLNDEQRQAVFHTDGPLLILAGAGSGKTRVLTERIVNMVEQGVSPSTILSVTFTNKAAAEMRSRVEKRIGTAARNIAMGTFHSICLRWLKQYAPLVGLSPNFTIFDDSDQQKLLRDILRELNIDEKRITPRGAMDRISRAKDAVMTPDELHQKSGNWYDEKIILIYQRYQELLRQQQGVDFGDLIMLCVQLLKNNETVRQELENRYRYIMVDEYQDTNHAQYELIRFLGERHRNVAVVGDDDQSIYSWRGADISNILEFEKDFKHATVIRLEQNYRSTKRILEAANHVVAKNHRRKGKSLWTDNAEGDKIMVHGAADEQAEARYVATRIQEHVRKGKMLSDMAIFYRTNAQSRVLEDILRRFQIPYRMFGGVRFYDRKEIRDILAYLKLIQNPSDMISLARVINVPARGIGKTTLDRLTEEMSRSRDVAWTVLKHALDTDLIGAAARRKVGSFVELIDELRNRVSEMKLPDFVRYVMESSGYWRELEQERTPDAETRLENLKELVSAVDDYCQQNPEATLADFIDGVALVSSIDNYSEEADAVAMMTLHLAKGLEFPVVFLTGMEEGLFPHSRSMENDAEMEEERRICYVGMTRGMEKVYMTYSAKRRVFGTERYNIKSRFLDELPSEHVEMADELAALRRGYGEFSTKTGKSTWNWADDDIPSQAPSWDDDVDQRPADERRSPAKSGASHAGHDGERTIRLGVRVRHSQFGQGTIRRVEGKDDSSKVTVYFDNGDVKKLMVKFANLVVE